jgi:hypothetical protein
MEHATVRAEKTHRATATEAEATAANSVWGFGAVMTTTARPTNVTTGRGCGLLEDGGFGSIQPHQERAKHCQHHCDKLIHVSVFF